jgi:ketosteroid isomerase-like protein
MRSDVTQTILEAYDSWWRGDLAGALLCFHPEAQVTVAGNPASVPFAGEYRGRDEVAVFFTRFPRIAPALMPTLNDLMVDGDRAVVRWTLPVVAGSTKAQLQILDVLRFRQGRIVALEQVFDTWAAAQVFGPPAPSRPQRRMARPRMSGGTSAAPGAAPREAIRS